MPGSTAEHHEQRAIALAQAIIRLNRIREANMAPAISRFIQDSQGNPAAAQTEAAGELIEAAGVYERLFAIGLDRAFQKHMLRPDLDLLADAEATGDPA